MTEVVKFDANRYNVSKGMLLQIEMRKSTLESWMVNANLNDRLSGTLKKNARLGFKYRGQLYHEALAQTLGYAFESEPASRITLGDPITEGDQSSITEAGWFVDRMLSIHPFEEDVFQLKYICVHSDTNGIIKEGIGVIMTQTNINWIRKGDLVFAIISEFDVKAKKWLPAVNPF